MIDFERFWAAGGPGGFGELPDDEFEADGFEEVHPGVDSETIRAWEAEHRVTLPELLRNALAIQNGGFVRNAPMEILPLEEIAPVDEEFWEFTEIEHHDAPNHDLMFVLGQETDVGGTYLLNFNAQGPAGEPGVYLDLHGESTYHLADSLEDLLNELLASSRAPGVNWSETKDLPALARESIDLSSLYRGKPASVDQVLVCRGEALVLFTRQRSPDGERLTRTLLPLPLDNSWVLIDANRPAPIGTYALHLQPTETDRIVHQESQTNADGMWKNSIEHGAPIYVTYESTRRESLESLRRQLLGDKAADQVQAKQDRQAELEATLDSLSPDQRMAAMLQSALKMKAELDREFDSSGAAENMPAGLGQTAELMQRRMEEMMQRAQEKIAANPPPDVGQKIEDVLRDLKP